jgi:hypothetical protein
MSVSVRFFFAWAMIVWLPASLLAGDTNSAVVHSKGGVWVNGAEATDSTVVFPGDLLETKPGFVANLDAAGSSVLIQPESVVKFQGTFLMLEHGSVEVGTSTSMGVHVNCIKVEPVSNDRTQYDVTDLTGTVRVAARKNDVSISQGALRKASSRSDAGQSPTVHEGQQAARDEAVACGAASRPEGAGTNGVNTKWLEIGGGTAGGVAVLCLILCKGPSSSNVSPSSP